MHVGVFSYYYLPVINGVTITIADWKKWGEQNGVTFTICIPTLDKRVSKDPSVVMYPSVPIYRRIGITVPMFPNAFVEKEFAKRRIDLIHVHHPFSIGNLALLTKKRLRVPLLFTYHTRYTDYVASYAPGFLAEMFTRSITRRIVRFINQCDAVTAANETLRDELRRNGVRTPVSIVPPGIDTKQYSSGNRDETRKRLGIAPQDTVLLYVGRLAKEKNIYFLMHAFARIHSRVPHIRMLLTGNGFEEHALRRFVEKNGLSARVLFATQETVKTIPGIYACADAFLYASQTETYGRVIVEAMSAALPIIALAGPSIVDLLRDGVTGRVLFHQSPEAFGDAVVSVLGDITSAKFLGLRAQKEARARYDSAVSWKQLFGVYDAMRAQFRASST